MTDDKRISNADLDWGGNAPRSVFFNDIYFSGDGPAETAHVFLAGNDLPARFQNAQRFTIGELGFGTGLNFLCVWDAWRKAEKPEGARLDFFSVEAFPLTRADLEKAHAHWPQFALLSQALIASYPPPHPGFHRLSFDDGVTLTLFIGDVLAGLTQAEGAFDAWFLDGFSPEKNPAMWRAELFEEMARLSKPGATFATFTVAGAVRRALQAADVAIEKRPGYGRKREMLAGRLAKDAKASPKRKPWFDTRDASHLNRGARIAVIGAGIAGASLAHELTRAGFAPIVFEAKDVASGASGNTAGLVMPRLDAGDAPAGAFHASAYLHTTRLLEKLQCQSSEKLFDPCGVVLHATSTEEKARQQKLLARPALPAGWIEAHKDGLFFPQGGVVDPPAFVKALLSDAAVVRSAVKRLHRDGDQWRVEHDGGSDAFDAVVIANGLDALRFAQARTLPLTGSAGQIDWFPDAPAPESARAFGPYAAPCPKGGLVIGATYAPAAIGALPAFTAEATQTNIKAVAKALPDLAASLQPDASRPRASIRCVTPDRMPVAGPVPDWGFYGGAYDSLREGKRMDYPAGETEPGLFVLTGLGSRGLVTAPLAAAMIAAEMAGAVSPVSLPVAEALHPARFFIRDLKRSTPVRRQRANH